LPFGKTAKGPSYFLKKVFTFHGVGIRSGATDSRLGLECFLSHELNGHAFQSVNAMANKKYN
jgi:hypothetical protein